MTVRSKKPYPALKHAGYSATGILPGESAAEFERLHKGLIREWAPKGVLEKQTILTMAHALWRQKNLATFRTAERARQRVIQIREATVPIDDGVPQSHNSDDFDKAFTEKCRSAERQAREQLGELYGLVELGTEATVGCLMADLVVQERLNATIDKCLKRLLMIRGLKSMSLTPTSAPLERLPGPSKAA